MSSSPGPATNLHAVLLRPTYAVLAWTPPSVGTRPFTYEVRFCKKGTSQWYSLGKTRYASAYLGCLTASTTYSIAVLTSN